MRIVTVPMMHEKYAQTVLTFRITYLFIDMWLHSTSVLSRTAHNSEIRYYLYIFFCDVFTCRFSATKLPKYRQLSVDLWTFQAMKLGYIYLPLLQTLTTWLFFIPVL